MVKDLNWAKQNYFLSTVSKFGNNHRLLCIIKFLVFGIYMVFWKVHSTVFFRYNMHFHNERFSCSSLFFLIVQIKNTEFCYFFDIELFSDHFTAMKWSSVKRSVNMNMSKNKKKTKKWNSAWYYFCFVLQRKTTEQKTLALQNCVLHLKKAGERSGQNIMWPTKTRTSLTVQIIL